MTIRGKITATNWYSREENEAGNRSGSKQQKWGRELPAPLVKTMPT
jgi:hypothetical protein